ncbi:MAG TPA: cytochrome c oxidase subunit II [Acidimicrobiales bacterium]
MTSVDPVPPVAPAREPHHFWRLFAIWGVLSAAADPLFYFLVGPHLPPGDMGSAGAGDQFDSNVLFVIAIPVVFAIVIYLLYAVIVWRSRPGVPEPVAGPSSHGNIAIQFAWIGITTVIVMGLFLFGTIELVTGGGSGGGEGSVAIWTLKSPSPLVVQVIAQQWKFSYRYPSLGGFETDALMLPDDTTVVFHVTSLDVIHDFWAYQLGVKADASPDYDNIAYTRTQQTGSFSVRCDELCGVWHGAMFDTGYVVSKTAFQTWATTTEAKLASATKLLPQFSWTYTPDANGADGGYYPDSQDGYSKVEVYGAQPVNLKSGENKG